MRVSFFSPIYASPTPNPSEKWKFLRGTTQFFNFGQKSFTLLHFTSNNRLEVGEKIASKPGLFGIVMRVSALFTVIIPLVMLMGALIYKARNHFEICARPSNLSPIPLEILNHILGFTGPSCLQFGETSKAHLNLVEDNLALKAHRVLPLLKRSYNLAHDFRICKIPILANVAKGFFFVDQARSMDIVEESIAVANTQQGVRRYSESYLKGFFDVLALLTAKGDEEIANKAIESAWALTDDLYRYHALAAIIEKLAVTNPQKADDIGKRAVVEINAINDELNKWKCTAAIIETVSILKQQCSFTDEILTLANTLNNKYETLAQIARVLSVYDLQRALEITENCILEANTLVDIEERSKALAVLAKALVVFNTQRAEVVANTIPTESIKYWTLANIAEAVATEDPQRALILAESIPSGDKSTKSSAFAAYITALSSTDPHRALELVNNWGHWPGHRCWGDSKDKALTAIVKVLATSDLSKALSVVNNERLRTTEFVEALAASNPQKALELINKKKINYYLEDLAVVAKALVKSDAINAKKLMVEALEDNQWSFNLNIIVDVLLVLDPDMAIKAINAIEDPLRKAEAPAYFASRYLQKHAQTL